MTFLVGVALWSVSSFWDGGAWLTKLTNWQTLIMAGYGLASFGAAVAIALRQGEALHAPTPHDSNARVSFLRMPWYVTLAWVFQNLAITFGVWVTISFWLLVNPLPQFNVGAHPENVVDHAITFAVVAIDFFASRIPYPLMMFVWSFVVGVLYVILTVALYYAGFTNDWDGGRYVYPEISWSPADLDNTLRWIVPTVLFVNPGVAVAVWYFSSCRADMREAQRGRGLSPRSPRTMEFDPLTIDEARQTAFERMRVPWIREQGAGAGRIARILEVERVARRITRFFSCCCCCCYFLMCDYCRRPAPASSRVAVGGEGKAVESPTTATANHRPGSAFSSSPSSLTPFSSSAIAQYMGKTSRLDDSRATPEVAARR